MSCVVVALLCGHPQGLFERHRVNGVALLGMTDARLRDVLNILRKDDRYPVAVWPRAVGIRLLCERLRGMLVPVAQDSDHAGCDCHQAEQPRWEP